MSENNIMDHEKKINMSLSYQDIALKLLNDKLLLTALEFHTELVETGNELRLLKDFFSNPGNFESHTNENPVLMTRSGSQATLDSLDFARYSEDGEQSTDERVAVLEFQLRKAKETISALRNNLTVATESENNSPSKTSIRQVNIEAIKPHEQRALNFLINEYLLLHGYKLTSITFADENENQDFEDWDDVGLNISKPAELLTLYREGLKLTGHTLFSSSSQTEFLLKNEEQEKELNQCLLEIQVYSNKVYSLEAQINTLQNDNIDLKKHNDILLCNTKKFTSSESVLESRKSNIISSSKNSTIGSSSPEHFEIIEKNNFVPQHEDSIVALDDNISNNSLNETDWSEVMVNTTENYLDVNLNKTNNSFTLINVFDIEKPCRNLSDGFKNELLKLCPVNVPIKVENEILDTVLNHEITLESLIHILSESLLRIIPNVILNKREEVIPLLISCVHLSTDCATRDKLLQQLFNLKKKPTELERSLILTGIIGIARNSKESLVENEILPQCWEQLAHKYTERRLLVAESCIALIPFVSGTIRNSLILSMLQQMFEDKEDTVRDSVVRALALVVALCDDDNKYNHCEELALALLQDSNPVVVNNITKILFPVLAKWSSDIGKLHTSLIKNLLHKLNNLLRRTKSDQPVIVSDLVLKVLTVLDHLLPFILLHVANKEYVYNRIEKDMAIELRSELLNLCTNLTNPNNFCRSEFNVGMILYEFDKLMCVDTNISWDEMEWFLENIIPDLLNNLGHVEISLQILVQCFVNLFSHICIIFGKNFTKHKIRPIFQGHIENLEQILSSFNQYCTSLNIIPVYLVSVLSYCDTTEEVSNVLKRFLYALPLCGTPLDCLEITVKGLCSQGLQETVVSSLWDGVVHQRPLVRGATASLFSSIIGKCNEILLSTKVTPALVTLANDSDILVRTATVPALGSLISDTFIKEIHDKAYMQLETFLSEVNVLDNHTLLRQLIVTLGNIVQSCRESFKREVIFPKFNNLANYTYQMSNQTRRIDMASALIESFSKVLFCTALDTHTTQHHLLPGLRCLEIVVRENSSLSYHHGNILSMIRATESKLNMDSSHLNVEKICKISNQSVEDVKQKVSKIFNNPVVNKSSTLPNLQGIFKKK